MLDRQQPTGMHLVTNNESLLMTIERSSKTLGQGRAGAVADYQQIHVLPRKKVLQHQKNI